MKCYYMSTLAVFALISSVYAESDYAYMGSVWATGSNYCPIHTLPADGRLLNIRDYQPLFNLFGTTYGGNGFTTFGLPNLSGRTPVGIGKGKDNTGTNSLTPVALGQQRGAQERTLTADNLPAHTHTATFTPSGTTDPIKVNIPVSTNTSGNLFTPDSTHSYMAGTLPGSSGAKMWAGAMSNPSIPVKGVTASGGAGSGSVTIDNTGNSIPILTVPPELGVTYCVTVEGIFPNRSN